MADVAHQFLPWAVLAFVGLACTVLMSINETLEAVRDLLSQIGEYYEAKAENHTAEAERIWKETARSFPEAD